MIVFVHGYDFVALGLPKDLDWYRKVMQKGLRVKDDEDDSEIMPVLNRLVA